MARYRPEDLLTSAVASSDPSTDVDAEVAFRSAERSLFADLGILGRERIVSLRGGAQRVRVIEVGEGPAVLHVHGGGAFGAVHAPLAAMLPGRRHILLDRPGFGLSERAPVAPDFRTRSVELLTGVMDALDLDEVDVIANSIGGAMALWLCLDATQSTRVRGLGLVGGIAMIGEVPSPLPFRLMATPWLGDLLLRLEPPSEKQVRTFFRRFGHDPDRVHPALLDMLLACERGPHFAGAWRDLVHATNTWRGHQPGLAISAAEMRSLRCRVAFAWGARDPMVDEAVGRRVADQQGAPFTVAGSGHCPWLDDAAGVARAIEPVLAPLS